MISVVPHSVAPQFPPIFGVDLLGLLLDKAPATILADRCRAPHKLPPACSPPGCKSPRWILEDVLNWLRQYQADQAAAPAIPSPKKRGRPSKAEQVANARKIAVQEGVFICNNHIALSAC
jgi:hypothetical protein